MQKPLILVTGAAGKTGFATVTELRRLDWPVRALVRSSKDRAVAKLESLGAEVVYGDLFDPAEVRAALQGVARAYYCPPVHPYMIQSAVVFADAAREAGLQSVVLLSQWLASPDHPSLLTRQHWLVERLFAMMPDVRWTILRPGYFADNYLGYGLTGMAAHLGIYPNPFGTSRNAPPSNEDIGRCAAAVLIDPENYHGQSFRPTGPCLLDGKEMGAVLARVLGRQVRVMAMPMFMLFKAMRVEKVPAFLQICTTDYNRDQEAGAFAAGAPTDHVELLTGHAAEDFETTVRRYTALPENQRTFSNKLTALGKFMLIGLVPPLNLKRIAAKMILPVPVPAHLALDSAAWRADRLHENHRSDRTSKRFTPINRGKALLREKTMPARASGIELGLPGSTT